ncbi:hypothetical protein [Vreelandella alkaliphila]|uniref:hypothetical protein n=1 Tax=Vreelandella alkaliphila TaxID=272774 RepID=UPI003FD8440E
MTLLSSRGHIHFLDLIPPAFGCAFLGNARLSRALPGYEMLDGHLPVAHTLPSQRRSLLQFTEVPMN